MSSAPDLRAWIGREERSEPDLITPRLLAGFRATLAPHLAPVDGAPAGIHWCLSPPVAPMAELGPDGHARRGGFLPPVPLPRRMWAGGTVEFLAPLPLGANITRTSRIVDIVEKSGKSGALTFVAVEHALHAGDVLCLRERHDIVYRPAAIGPLAAPPPEPEPDAPIAKKWNIAVDPVLLFRYSALTFNGHRIHYDLAYARDVEFYPDLVIHGPLQATILVNLAASIDGALPKLFRFRGMSPVCGTQQLFALAWRTVDGVSLAMRSAASGVITMKAEATW